ncbi:MAG: peptidase C39 family protein [Candidatus Thermoplasmatota archaeon]|nr:peptidase C39 family protein [Candidatus Thermoplasmatota archaeon]
MNINKKNNSNILDVPYYQQSRQYTCGPASLMMVMKYWDRKFEFSKNTEFDLWLKSNPFVFLGGTLQYGLARTAMKKGFKTEIYQTKKFSDSYLKFRSFINLYEYIISFGARHLKIPVYLGREIFDVIRESLDNGIPPLVFLNLKPIINENVFHWVVVTGMDDNFIYLNDPYIPRHFILNMKKNHPVEIKVFKMAIATDGVKNLRMPPCVVLVYK